MSALPWDRGLDEDGNVRREGDLSRIQPEFAPLVREYAAAARAAFGPDLDSIYLYGSVPRGTARLGTSDLDGQLLLTREPTEADRGEVRRLEEELGAAHPQVSFVGILLDARATLTDPADRWDGGFHLRVLCTPLWGPDAGQEIAAHRVGMELARGVQGDWRSAVDTLRREAARLMTADDTGAAVAALCRSTGRRLARIAFAWVMPRWGGWSSDPVVMQQVVAALEPGWEASMAAALRLGWDGVADLDLAQELLSGFSEDLIAHGSAIGA